ncbi:MAG: hypothetical protein OXF74_08900 [Rhodobacteraceae bacterium]|nr:hypothetical protein [Paracoccaceae bacterium]
MAISAGLSAWTALQGTRRLAPESKISARQTVFVCFAGAIFGTAVIFLDSPYASKSGTQFAAIALYALLAAAAFIDWRTGWAPTELMLPLTASAFWFFSTESAWLALAVGSGSLACAWCLWAAQRAFGAVWIPPADCIALALPLLLFQSGAGAVAAYALIALILGGFAAGGDRLGRVMLPGRRVTFLAISLPVVMFGSLLEAALRHTGFTGWIWHG